MTKTNVIGVPNNKVLFVKENSNAKKKNVTYLPY